MNDTELDSLSVEEIDQTLQNEHAQVNGRVDGNAFAIMAACSTAIRQELKGEIQKASIEAFLKVFTAECMSGDYDHLLQTCMKYVDFNF